MDKMKQCYGRILVITRYYGKWDQYEILQKLVLKMENLLEYLHEDMIRHRQNQVFNFSLKDKDMDETVEKCYQKIIRTLDDYDADDQYGMIQELSQRLLDRADNLMKEEYM